MYKKLFTTLFIFTVVALLLPVSAAAQSVPFETVFYEVRDTTGFEIYGGNRVPLESIDTLTSGNSLDRALLLYKKLRDAGYKPELIQGVLSQAAQIQLLAAWFGADADSIDTNDPMIGNLMASLRDHFWVRIALQNGYLNLDPSLPDAEPGTTQGAFRKVLKRLPSDVYQRFEIVITADFRVGGARAKSRLARYISNLDWTKPTDISLFFVNRNINESYTVQGDKPLYPILTVDGVVQPAINLQVEAARLAATQNITTPTIELERVWLEIKYQCPARKDIIASRLLHDADHPEKSRLFAVTSISIFPDSVKEIVADIPALSNANSNINQDWKPAFLTVLSDREKEQLSARVHASHTLGSFLIDTYWNVRQAGISCYQSAFDREIKAVGGAPGIIGCYINPLNGVIELDLLLLETSVYSVFYPRSTTLAANLISGIYSTAVEHKVLARLLPSVNKDNRILNAYSESKSHTSWLILSRNSIEKLAGVHLASEARKNMSDALLSGKLVVLPASEQPLLWWEINPLNGNITGMVSDGIGGARWQQNELPGGFHTASANENWGFLLSQNIEHAIQITQSNPLDGTVFLAEFFSQFKEVALSILANSFDETGNQEFSVDEIRIELRKLNFTGCNIDLTAPFQQQEIPLVDTIETESAIENEVIK